VDDSKVVITPSCVVISSNYCSVVDQKHNRFVTMVKEKIYVIYLNFGDGEKIRCKIGRTANLEKRLQDIKTAFPGEHEVIAVFDTVDGTAKDVEAYVLASLEEYRCREGGGKELFDFTKLKTKDYVAGFVEMQMKDTVGMFDASVEWKKAEKEAVDAGWTDPKTIVATSDTREKVKRIRVLQSMSKVLDLECGAIKDSLRTEFAKERASEITVSPGDVLKFTEVTTDRINTKRLREKYPDIADECTDQSKSRRLTVGT